MAIGHDLLRNEIGSISDKINLKIFAESKGALTWGEHLPLGMVGEKTQGMLLCFPVCILGMVCRQLEGLAMLLLLFL